MTTSKINTEKNGVELYFDAIPSVATRDALKANGWRWSRFCGCWYNENTPENEQFAQGLADGDEATATTAPDNPSPWTTAKPADKYAKAVLGYVQLSTGVFVPFDKTKIRTQLCFGYDERVDGSTDDAERRRDATKTNYDYFERLQCVEIDRDIETITRALDVQEERANGVLGCYSARDFVFIFVNDWRGPQIADWKAYNPEAQPIEQAAGVDDLRAILAGLNALREHKQKQARTYWKRFGGSKLHAWTFSTND